MMLVALVVGAAVAGVELLHPVGGGKFRAGHGEAHDHDHGDTCAPGQPGKAAGQADEELRPGDEVQPFLQR
ncbi:MAG: hypothetical protein II178_00120, partial [Selenomonadaceae bacterium]|nr:hypothetical protein [Selenomonadaceae bacterium]